MYRETRTYSVEFFDSGMRAIDVLSDIRKAAEEAAVNLKQRHGVILDLPISIGNQVIMTVHVPPDTKFDPHNLRGINQRLLKMEPEFYKEFQCGTRLLVFREIPNYPNKTQQDVEISLSNIKLQLVELRRMIDAMVNKVEEPIDEMEEQNG